MTTTEAKPTAETPSADRAPRGLAALAGILAAAVSLGIAELFVVLLAPSGSPVVAVGDTVIRLAPSWLTEFAKNVFYTYDKLALLVGTGILLAVFAAAVGRLALRRPALGMAGVVLFGLVGAVCAVTAPVGGLLDGLPSIIGAAAGCGALGFLISTLTGVPVGTPTPVERPSGVDRRDFLKASLVAAGVAAAAGGIGLFFRERIEVAADRAGLKLPKPFNPAPAVAAGGDLSKKAALDGITPLLTPNGDFYRIDTALTVPQIRRAGYRLTIGGRVKKPLTLTLDDLLKRDLIERDITIACVSNEVGGDLNGSARWLGVPLKPLLEEAGIEPGADQILSTSSDGWTCGTPTDLVMDGRDAMLAIGMNGEPLPVEHGFPVRMIVPGLFGYVSATKWLTEMKLTTFSAETPYWIERGWAERGPVKTFSRIDIPADGRDLTAGDAVIAGIAYATHRGISKVEVRVDNGSWQEATLSAEDNPDLWRQWYLPWKAKKGKHILTVRATDNSGETQPEEAVPSYPDGAEGWHQRSVNVS